MILLYTLPWHNKVPSIEIEKESAQEESTTLISHRRPILSESHEFFRHEALHGTSR